MSVIPDLEKFEKVGAAAGGLNSMGSFVSSIYQTAISYPSVLLAIIILLTIYIVYNWFTSGGFSGWWNSESVTGSKKKNKDKDKDKSGGEETEMEKQTDSLIAAIEDKQREA